MLVVAFVGEATRMATGAAAADDASRPLWGDARGGGSVRMVDEAARTPQGFSAADEAVVSPRRLFASADETTWISRGRAPRSMPQGRRRRTAEGSVGANEAAAGGGAGVVAADEASACPRESLPP